MPGDGDEQDAARGEDAVQRREGGADVVDELQRLGHDRAVERVVRDVRRVREVADDGRLGVALRRHEDVHPLDAAAEAARVVGRGDLEHPAADVLRVPADEALDVDAVDRWRSNPQFGSIGVTRLRSPVRRRRRRQSTYARRAGLSRRRTAEGRTCASSLTRPRS